MHERGQKDQKRTRPDLRPPLLRASPGTGPPVSLAVYGRRARQSARPVPRSFCAFSTSRPAFPRSTSPGLEARRIGTATLSYLPRPWQISFFRTSGVLQVFRIFLRENYSKQMIRVINGKFVDSRRSFRCAELGYRPVRAHGLAARGLSCHGFAPGLRRYRNKV